MKRGTKQRSLRKISVVAIDPIKRSRTRRLFIVQAVLVVLFAILLCRLWELQIVNGQKYADDFEVKSTRTIKENNTRGLIYDCNGEILAYNERVYTIEMIEEGTYHSERERQLTLNSILYHIVRKLEENQEQINNELKIHVGIDGEYEYTVTGTALLRFKADIFGLANPVDLTFEQKNMSAQDLIEFLSSNNKFALYGEGKNEYSEKERAAYGLPKSYSNTELVTIVGFRYMLSLHAYRKYVPIVLARNVSEQTVAYVQENNQLLRGVNVEQDWERVYTGGEAFSHILGYVGKISSEEMEKYTSAGKEYHSDSVVGKVGIEQYLEEQLQGIDGERTITINNVGKKIGEDEIVKEMVSGRDVYLSIDKDLQIAVYHILEQHLAGIIASNLVNLKRFDKTHLSDTSAIRIPIYDVYIALIENDVIRLNEFYALDATQLEQRIVELMDVKREDVTKLIRTELMEGNTDYDKLSEELQEYMVYIVNQLGVLDVSSIDQKDDIYQKWKNKKKISVKAFLMHAIESGWIADGFMEVKQGYFTTEEMYVFLEEEIENRITKDSKMDKLLLKWMILEDTISGKEICKLLYD